MSDSFIIFSLSEQGGRNRCAVHSRGQRGGRSVDHLAVDRQTATSECEASPHGQQELCSHSTLTSLITRTGRCNEEHARPGGGCAVWAVSSTLDSGEDTQSEASMTGRGGSLEGMGRVWCLCVVCCESMMGTFDLPLLVSFHDLLLLPELLLGQWLLGLPQQLPPPADGEHIQRTPTLRRRCRWPSHLLILRPLLRLRRRCRSRSRVAQRLIGQRSSHRLAYHRLVLLRCERGGGGGGEGVDVGLTSDCQRLRRARPCAPLCTPPSPPLPPPPGSLPRFSLPTRRLLRIRLLLLALHQQVLTVGAQGTDLSMRRLRRLSPRRGKVCIRH